MYVWKSIINGYVCIWNSTCMYVCMYVCIHLYICRGFHMECNVMYMECNVME